MNLVNAIAKVRFSSSKPQQVLLHKADSVLIELICMEGGQELRGGQVEEAYYVVTGTATITADGKTSELPANQLAGFSADEPHVLANSGERRLICLMITTSR